MRQINVGLTILCLLLSGCTYSQLKTSAITLSLADAATTEIGISTGYAYERNPLYPTGKTGTIGRIIFDLVLLAATVGISDYIYSQNETAGGLFMVAVVTTSAFAVGNNIKVCIGIWRRF